MHKTKAPKHHTKPAHTKLHAAPKRASRKPVFAMAFGAPRRSFASNDKQKKGDASDNEKSAFSDREDDNAGAEGDAIIGFQQRIKKQNNEIDELKRQLNEQALIIEEWKGKSKALQERVKQEIEEQNNIHERYRREIADVKKFTVGKFAKGLLEGIDALESASKATDAALERNKDDAFVKLAEGLQMTTALMQKALAKEGITKFESLGHMVDPNMHFITAQLPHPTAPAGTITHILKEGYMIHERVLRPAQVCVAKADV